jgi:elongation factor G
LAKYKSEDIRNIVLCGHGGSGKTMLAESMLFKTKAVSRLGSIADGTTVSDFDHDEKERRCSLAASVMHCSFGGKEINIVDTPGAMDFVGGMIGGVSSADLAVICVNAAKGVEVSTRKAWDLAGHLGLGRMIVLTRMDSDNVNYQEILAGLQKTFGNKCAPFVIPDGEGNSFKGVTLVLGDGASGDEVEELKVQIIESAIESNDALMEKYLEEGTVAPEAVLGAIQNGIAAGTLVPVFCVASEKDLGVNELLTGIANWGPSPLTASRVTVKETKEKDVEGKTFVKLEEVPLAVDPAGKLAAQVFKVVSDPHVGKLAFLRVFSGTLASKSNAFVSSTGKQEKIAQLLRCQGDKREEVTEAVTGDIVAVAKVDCLTVGDTVYGEASALPIKAPIFPRPMAGLAVTPKSRGDEQKMSTYMHRLCDEDQTFIFERSELTKEQVVRGVGQLHLDVMLHRLKARYGLEVDTHQPRIPYLESITAEAEGSYRHKKQSGGSGQFGEVHLRLKPNERGGGFEFVNAIVGGVISQPYIPSVEKGVVAAMEFGPIAGYPMVDVVVELFYGKEHPVDSKDIAFQLAGRHAFSEIVQKCKPSLLEPIVNMEIVFPSAYFGDISGDISTRRGRPTGTDQMGDMQVLKVQVPLAEVANYGSSLNAITQGEGFYTMELSHYEVVPSNIAQQVAARAKAEAAAAEK